MTDHRRFYLETLEEGERKAMIGGPEFHHLSNVLRLKIGDSLTLFNGRGLEAQGVIKFMKKGSATVTLSSFSMDTGESPTYVVLLQGLLKAAKNELIIEKCTELGVSEIRFFQSEHTVAKPGEGAKDLKIERWRRIALKAVKQCGRTRLPKLSLHLSLDEAVADLSGETKIALHEKEQEEALGKSLEESISNGNIAILIGPEGGLGEQDLKTAKQAGFVTAGLGPRRLRSETAAMVSVYVVIAR